jgi:hypothetical protein
MGALWTLSLGASVARAEGIVFGVKPGMGPVQSSYLGYQAGTLLPFVGMDFVRLSASVTEDGNKEEASAFLMVPNFGSRLYVSGNRNNGGIASYLQGSLLFSLPSVNADGLSDEDKKLVEDLLGFWGLSLAFGAEYYFSDRFSVGGEYGLRHLAVGADVPDEGGDGYGGGGVGTELNATFSISYVAVVMNFHL